MASDSINSVLGEVDGSEPDLVGGLLNHRSQQRVPQSILTVRFLKLVGNTVIIIGIEMIRETVAVDRTDQRHRCRRWSRTTDKPSLSSSVSSIPDPVVVVVVAVAPKAPLISSTSRMPSLSSSVSTASLRPSLSWSREGRIRSRRSRCGYRYRRCRCRDQSDPGCHRCRDRRCRC